jgi:hypothetical protein
LWILSPFEVDQSSIRQVFGRFGTDWTAVEVAWPNSAAVLGKPDERPISARLRWVAGIEIFTSEGSPGWYIKVPQSFAPSITTRPYQLPRDEIYRWAIPQLELAADTLRQLPDAYSEDWRFGESDQQRLQI